MKREPELFLTCPLAIGDLIQKCSRSFYSAEYLCNPTDPQLQDSYQDCALIARSGFTTKYTNCVNSKSGNTRHFTTLNWKMI